jgi:hypothetical protein
METFLQSIRSEVNLIVAEQDKASGPDRHLALHQSHWIHIDLHFREAGSFT